MAREKMIVLGCDDADSLPAILNSMKKISGFLHSVISVSSINNIISVVASVKPDLVIMSFRNNQTALSDFFSGINKKDLPLLCLNKRSEGRRLSWEKNRIVFTYPFEQINEEGSFGSIMQSIFLMKDEGIEVVSHSLAASAIHNHQYNNTADLSRYVMELDQKAEVLLKIRERITCLYPRVDDPTRIELTSIVNSIKASANDAKLWADFKLYFEQNNPGFLLRMAQKHPGLTQNDLKYCCYLKMNMTNDDIRSLLGINQESVRTHKYRLKKKMRLSKEQSLRTYLVSFDQTIGMAQSQEYSSVVEQGTLF